MILPVVYYGNKQLRMRSEPVTEFGEELRLFVEDLIETMDAKIGCGLAAPQVGRLIRVFVLRDYIETEDGRVTLSRVPRVYVNPKILCVDGETATDTEGCVSIPRLRAPVARPLRITIEAVTIKGEPFTEEAEGYNARIRMHENDHLNGVLFIDRLEPSIRRKIEPMLKVIEKNYK